MPRRSKYVEAQQAAALEEFVNNLREQGLTDSQILKAYRLSRGGSYYSIDAIRPFLQHDVSLDEALADATDISDCISRLRTVADQLEKMAKEGFELSEINGTLSIHVLHSEEE